LEEFNTNINKISDSLYQLTLSPPITGFSGFISVWLKTGKPSFIVDVGPSSVAGELINALTDLGVRRLDYILLTHIHVDHAGGIGEISSHFPDTPIVCHSSGIPHLIDPSRLWEGTVKTLGDTGRAYGGIKPVSSERFIETENFSLEAVKPVFTPGHASHHVSFIHENLIFAGEAGGVFTGFPSGDEYLRPATPPRLFLETALESVDTLIAAALDVATASDAEASEIICYGHTGFKNNGVGMLRNHKEQLLFWKKFIGDIFQNSREKDLYKTCLDALLANDPFLKGFEYLSEEAKERERFFLLNSIKGFEGYLKTVADNP